MAVRTLYTKAQMEDVFNAVTKRVFPTRADQGGCFNVFWTNYQSMSVEDAYRAARSGATTVALELKRINVGLDRIDKQATIPKGPSKKAENAQAIQIYIKLIDESWKRASEIASQADTAAKSAKELAKEFPSLQSDVDVVINKVTTVKETVRDIGEARRKATVAEVTTDRPAVEAGLVEVDIYLAELIPQLEEINDGLEKLEEAAENKRFFKKIIDEIKGIRKKTESLVKDANDATPAAEKIRDNAAEPKWRSWLRNKIRRPLAETEVEAAFNRRSSAVGSLVTFDTAVGTALTAAQTAETSNDKTGAGTALSDANKAKEDAEKANEKIVKATEELEKAAREKTPGPISKWWILVLAGVSVIGLLIEYMIISRSVPESWRWLFWIPFVLFGILGSAGAIALALEPKRASKVVSAHVIFHVVAIALIVVLQSNAPGVDKIIPVVPTATIERSQEETVEDFQEGFQEWPTPTPTPND